MKTFGSLVLASLMVTTCVRAVIFEMRPNREKCFTEQGRKGTAFSGKFALLYSDTLEQVPSKTYNNMENDGRYFIFRANDPSGKEIFRTEEHMGTFHFVPTTDGSLELCFADIGSGITRKRSVSFDHHHGTTSEEYKEIAKRDQLYPIAAELRKLEDDVWAIKDEMKYQKKREEDLRDLNEDINAKAAWLPLYAIVVLAVSTVIQVNYLKRFFIKKKMI